MWLRLAYPQFKTDLLKALQRLKTILAADDIAGVEYDTPNTNRARYVHMLNLYSIFEFCIPAIQDYLVVLKSNNWEEFRCCFRRCRFFLSCLYLHAISHRIHNIIFFVIQSCNFHSICVVVLCLIGCSSSSLCVRRRVHWTINVQCTAMSLCCDIGRTRSFRSLTSWNSITLCSQKRAVRSRWVLWRHHSHYQLVLILSKLSNTGRWSRWSMKAMPSTRCLLRKNIDF